MVDSRNGVAKFFLALTILLIAGRLISRLVDAASGVHWVSFGDSSLVIPLLLVVFLYSMIGCAAVSWSSYLRIPSLFLYLVIPFLIYFICVLNFLTINFDSVLLIRSVVFGILFIPVILNKQSKKEMSLCSKPTLVQLSIWFLVVLFVLHGMFLFLDHSFISDRMVVADEKSFWYTAAIRMVDSGILSAHQMSYSGGGLHPFGVPFVSAFPSMFWGLPGSIVPYFLPVYILGGIVLFLLEFSKVDIRRRDWTTIFFIITWFVAFNNRSWVGNLMYALTYGESVSTLFVLSLLSWLAIGQKGHKDSHWYCASFLIGMLVLTKFPLILNLIFFFSVFLFRAHLVDGWKKRVPIMFALFVLPWIVLQFFQMKVGIAVGGSVGPLEMFFDRLMEPNIMAIQLVYENIVSDAESLWYGVLLSCVAIFFMIKNLRYGWPIAIWILFLVVHYAYMYQYENPGSGDYGSGLRYFMPAAGGLIFLASMSYGYLMEKVEGFSTVWFQAVLYLLCIVPLFLKFF